MIRRRRPRRILAGSLVVLGVVLMLIAPDSPGGFVLLALGILIELVGIRLEHKA